MVILQKNCPLLLNGNWFYNNWNFNKCDWLFRFLIFIHIYHHSRYYFHLFFYFHHFFSSYSWKLHPILSNIKIFTIIYWFWSFNDILYFLFAILIWSVISISFFWLRIFFVCYNHKVFFLSVLYKNTSYLFGLLSLQIFLFCFLDLFSVCF